MGDSSGVLSVVDLDAVLDELESQEEIKQNSAEAEEEAPFQAAKSATPVPPESSAVEESSAPDPDEVLQITTSSPQQQESDPVAPEEGSSSSSSTFESIYDTPASDEGDRTTEGTSSSTVAITAEAPANDNTHDTPNEPVNTENQGSATTPAPPTSIPLESPPPYR